jgi:alcohol oxidase
MTINLLIPEQWGRTLAQMDQQRRECPHRYSWISTDHIKTGRRSDSAHAYIHSTREVHSNLHLMCNTKVDKVIIEDGVAVGVRTVPTKPLHPDVSSPFPSILTSSQNIIDTSTLKQQRSRTFRARKQIVISGGTLSSPLILQRSGIGDPKKLEAVGVKPIVDLPGVGLNFQDHYLTFSVFRAKPGNAPPCPLKNH